MSSLFASLHIGQRALQIQQLALEVTQRNIANANTPYYSRQRVNLTPGDSVGWGVDAPGGGVVALSVDAFRSRFLDYHPRNASLEQQTQQLNDRLIALQRETARPYPYRFEIRQSGSSCTDSTTTSQSGSDSTKIRP